MDEIVINGLRVFGYHGVNETEREQGQYFVVGVAAAMDLKRAGASDLLDETVDYSDLVKDIERIVSTERYSLLEALAERIAGAVLEHPQVRSVTVKVAKPDPPIEADLESVQVVITRP